MDVGSNLNWISWIVLGAVAGWIASMIAGTNQNQGWLMNIVVGIVGAFLGGAILSFVQGGQLIMLTWNLGSFVAAIAGAVILLFILRTVQGNR